MEEYYRMVMKLPCAFCTIDYALFVLNFMLYAVTDLKDISFCREHIDSFMMFAGFILFFAIKDRISYYSNKLYDKIASFFNSLSQKSTKEEIILFPNAEKINFRPE